jgi:hypothetical protein
MKMAVFWVVAAVLAAPIIRAIIALMMGAAITSETSVNLYQTAQCYNPEDSYHLLNNSYNLWLQFSFLMHEQFIMYYKIRRNYEFCPILKIRHLVNSYHNVHAIIDIGRQRIISSLIIRVTTNRLQQ